MSFALPMPAPQSPDWARLVPLARAAVLLGQHRDHLSRLCRDKLQHQGLAIFARPQEGGQAQWFVHRNYDPRLIDGQTGADWIEPDLAGFTLHQQERAIARRACVEELRRARSSWQGRMKDWLPRLVEQLAARFKIPVSRSSLLRWDHDYRRPADLAKLVDERGGDNRGRTSAEAVSMLRDLYLHPNRPSIRQVWKQVAIAAKDNGWTWCSYRSCLAQLGKWIPPEVQLRHREPAKWRQTLRPYIEQDPEAWGAGELWVSDHKQLDLICRFSDALIRPWITSWQDWRTRRIVGWVLSDQPNSSTILAALRHGLLDDRNFGGPLAVLTDNGRDYDAWVFHGQTKKQRRERRRFAVDEPRALGIFNMLGIEAHFSIPDNPNSKARQERWFRTLADFCRLFDTYTGDGPDTKPERLNEILASPHRVPAFEQVYERLGAHIAGYNASSDHAKRDLRDEETGELLSPDEAMARWCSTRHVMRDPKSLDLLLLQWHRPVTVGRNGITLTLRGRSVRYGQFEPALMPFKGARKSDRRKVIVAYDPHDIRTVRVYDEKLDYLCTVEMNQLGGAAGNRAVSLDHVAQLNRARAQYEKATKHTAEHSLTQCLTNEEQLADLAARKPRPAANRQGSPNLKIRPTPLDGQSREVERDQLKAAVGAECRSAPRPSVFDKLQKITPARDDSPPADVSDPWAKATLLRLQQELNHV